MVGDVSYRCIEGKERRGAYHSTILEQRAKEKVVIEEPGSMTVNCTKGVVQQDILRPGVNRSRECDPANISIISFVFTPLTKKDKEPSLLPATQTDASRPNLSLVSILQHLQIRIQCTALQDLVVPFLIVWESKENVILDRLVAEPGCLGSIRDGLHKSLGICLQGVFMEDNSTRDDCELAEKRHLVAYILSSSR